MSMDYNALTGYGFVLGFDIEDDFDHLSDTNTVEVKSVGASGHGLAGWILVARGSYHQAHDLVGFVEPSELKVQSSWDADLKKYCKDNSLQYKEPCWLLSWIWT